MGHIRCLVIVTLAMANGAWAQPFYFPPTGGSTDWETMDPAVLGWCPDRIDSLYNYLDQHNSKAFLVLKGGKIVLEHYTGTFTADSLWYWASAGKTLKSTLVGIAQEEGFLDIDAPTSTYLGTGWTSETPAQEQLITVRHQLTMTTGLDDGVADQDCTDPSCLSYLADAGTRWAYHNAPYTLLGDVVTHATGMPYRQYFNEKIRDPIGMNGIWVPYGEVELYFSTARSMARFGLLALNHMVWGTDTILHDTAFFHAATTPSQTINLSYGYLWWLNGQPSYMLPQSQWIFAGPIIPDGPADMFCGLGKNNQLLNVVPSQNLVLVRMGNDPDPNTPSVSTIMNDRIWQLMGRLDCNAGLSETSVTSVRTWPNPCTDKVHVDLPQDMARARVSVKDALGRMVAEREGGGEIQVGSWAPGVYQVQVAGNGHKVVSRFLKQ